MARYRLSSSAQADIADILDWSRENFGDGSRDRYAALIAAGIRHAAERDDDIGFGSHPALGDGVLTWHLALSKDRVHTGRVARPRHVLVCRRDGDVIVIGRVLHEAMDPTRHLDSDDDEE